MSLYMSITPQDPANGGPTRRDRVAHLPAGKYAIGDPCYTVPDDLWMEYLEAGTEGQDLYYVDGKTIQLSDGRLVAAHGTAWGDGCYPATDGFVYPVDAGLLGVVQVFDGEQVRGDLAQVKEFDAPFTVSYEDGEVIIGSLVISTDQSSDDDYDDEEE